jgi:hypothetical protein
LRPETGYYKGLFARAHTLLLDGFLRFPPITFFVLAPVVAVGVYPVPR